MSEKNNTEEDEVMPAADELQPISEPETKPITVTITSMELEKLQKESAEYKDKYIRLLAESENARKRMQKERQDMIQYALQNTITDFLIPIDHMENALKHAKQMSDEVKHWAVGFEMILGQFKDVLSNNGIAPFESQGQPFDPHLHEAVEMIETDEHVPGTVVEQTIRGYKMGSRIIRPARVTVAKAPTKQPAEIQPADTLPSSTEETSAELE